MRIYCSFRNITLILGLFCYLSSVSQEIICKDNTKLSKEKEAIVILPGFGDSKKGRDEQEKFFKEKGYDLFILLSQLKFLKKISIVSLKRRGLSPSFFMHLNQIMQVKHFQKKTL